MAARLAYLPGKDAAPFEREAQLIHEAMRSQLWLEDRALARIGTARGFVAMDTAINCSGSVPPPETGLVCNSWYGKFHLDSDFPKFFAGQFIDIPGDKQSQWRGRKHFDELSQEALLPLC